MVVQAMYTIIDRIYVGHGSGTLAISGITVCFPVMAVFMAFGMLFGMGGASLFSIRLGEGKEEEAARIAGNTFILLVMVSLSLCVLAGLFLEPILRAFGASRGCFPFASAYLGVMLFGIPLQAVGFGMNNFIRALGRPLPAMVTMVIGAVLNAALAPAFIFGLGMGIRGAALGTVIAQGLSCAWVMRFFISPQCPFRLRRRNLRLRAHAVREILAIGLAPFFLQTGTGVAACVLNHQLLRYGGDTAVSAFGIIHGITVLVLMPVIGISQGAQPVMGYNYGAGNFGRVRHTLFIAIAAATAVVTAGFCAAMAAPGMLIGFFNPSDIQLRETGSAALRIFLAMLPLTGFQVCVCGYFLAVGKPYRSILLTLSRQMIALLPCLLVLPRLYGLTGVWMAGPAADLFAFLLAAVFLFRENRRPAGV